MPDHNPRKTLPLKLIVIEAVPRSDHAQQWIYRFGNILVEPAAHRLEREGQPLSVESKVYALLILLHRPVHDRQHATIQGPAP